MFLLYVKGRGYFNGYKTSVSTDWTKTIRKETDHFQNRTYKVEFKRDYNQIKSTNTFNSKEEAQVALDEIQGIIVKGQYSETEDSWYGGWNCADIPCKRRITADLTPLKKIIDKIEIVEEEFYMVFKKTNRLNIIWNPFVSKTRGNKTICKTCRINLTPDEPFLRIDDVLMCKHCVEKVWNELSIQYDAHPNAKDIETAWQTEMVTREI